MNTINGHENGYVFQPQTAAGQLLQTGEWLSSLERLTVQVSDNQTAFDLEAVETVAPANRAASVQLYDYARDGVFAEEPLSTRRIGSWRGWKNILPAVELHLTDRGNNISSLSAQFTMQNPNETFRQGRVVAREVAGEVGQAIWAAGGALVDEFNEVREEAKADDEAVWALGFICGQVILKHLEQLGEPTEADLIGSITREYHDLPKAPEFRALIVRLRKWPNGLQGYKQSLAQLDQQVVAEYLPLVPAFHDFCAKHEIDPNEVLGS